VPLPLVDFKPNFRRTDLTCLVATVFIFISPASQNSIDLLSKTANKPKSKERLSFALGIKTIEFEKVGEICELFLKIYAGIGS
jgi:hypothetical protein